MALILLLHYKLFMVQKMVAVMLKMTECQDQVESDVDPQLHISIEYNTLTFNFNQEDDMIAY